MSNLTSLNIKIDRDIKAAADQITSAMGMTLSTAINVFVRQMVLERSIPFRIHLDNENERFVRLIDSIRDENWEKGFLSDEEIEAEIQAARAESQTAEA